MQVGMKVNTRAICKSNIKVLPDVNLLQELHMTSAQWATDNDLFMMLAITPSLVALGVSSALREVNVNILSGKKNKTKRPLKRKVTKKKKDWAVVRICISSSWSLSSDWFYEGNKQAKRGSAMMNHSTKDFKRASRQVHRLGGLFLECGEQHINTKLSNKWSKKK